MLSCCRIYGRYGRWFISHSAILLTSPLSDQLNKVHGQFLNTTPDDWTYVPPDADRDTYTEDASKTQKLETERRVLFARHEDILLKVTETEVRMNITRRWEKTDPSYVEVLKYVHKRAYQRALDHLQKLVVQRLFELQKLNLAKTGTFSLLYHTGNC